MLRRAQGSAGCSTINLGWSRSALALLGLRRSWRLRAVLAMAVGLLLLQVAPAGAVVRHGPPPTRAKVRGNTEMRVTDWYPGQSVNGFIADPSNPFDPVADGYPAHNPTDGWSTKNEGFAGVIHGMPPGGGATSEPLLHRHQYRHVGRHRLRPRHVGRLQRQERRLRGADPQRVLPQHRTCPPWATRTKRRPPCRQPSGSSVTDTC